MPGSAREEAERLVAAILARASASSAGGNHSSGDGFGLLGESVMSLLGATGPWSTGSAECCVCPVCKAIAAVRDPAPETAERLATSAADIAGGVAGLMRAFSALSTERPRPPAPRGRPAPAPDQAWAAATRADGEEPPAAPDEDADPWGAASAADAREVEAAKARARAEAAAARARAAEAAAAVARAVEQARAVERSRSAGASGTSGRSGPPASGPRSGGGGDVWAMATAAGAVPDTSAMGTPEVAADDAAAPRSVDHELGAPAPEDRDPGPGDGAAPGGAV